MGVASRCLLGLVLGAIGGAMAWLATDFIFNPLSDPEAMMAPVGHWGPVLGPCMNFFYGSMLGLFLCLAIGTADGLQSGSRIRLTRSAVRGALSGLIGGGIGYNLGNIVFSAAGGHSNIQSGSGMAGYLSQIFIRSLGWTIMGALFGGVYGLLESGPVKGRNGAIGGALGGFLGGLVFNPLAFALPNLFPFLASADRVARLVGFALLGAFIGFFTALVNQLLKTAWVFVLYGRNEGKEIILERANNRIGRSELAEIPVFRDGLIAANHAEIRLHQGRYTLLDGGTAVGTSVNGQKVLQPVLLKDSDLIQVGNTQVVFYERATAGQARRQVDVANTSPAAPPVVPEGSCPFCGQREDPLTGACACTVAPGLTDAVSNYPGPQGPAAGYIVPASEHGFSAFPGQAPMTGSGVRLLALSGPHEGEQFPIQGGIIVVGRDPSNQIALTRDTTVSRRHASVTPGPGGYTITDLGSSNGTFVNGSRISSSPAGPGDEVTFGTARFRIEG